MQINDKGELTVNIVDILDAVDFETKREIAKYIACDEEVMRSVVEQLADGVTFDEDGGWWLDSMVLTRLRAKLVHRLDDIERTGIECLLYQLSVEKKAQERISSWAWQMYHAWGKTPRPEMPDYVYANLPTEAEVDAAIEAGRSTETMS